MGKPAQSAPQAYRDEADQDAVSMHTTRDDYEYDDLPELPSYSDSEAAASSSAQQSQPPPTRTETVPVDPYQSLGRSSAVHTVGGKVKNSNATSIRMEPDLVDPEQLQKYIEDYIRIIPPSPKVRIVGTHQENRYNASKKKTERERVTDFDISFNLQGYLKRDEQMWHSFVADNSDKAYRGRFYKSRAPGYKQDVEVGESANPSLQDWCRGYCSSKSYLKVFRIERQLAGFTHQNIKNRVENFVRSTHYHGHLDISFPLEDKNVDIYNPHWINRARISWVRYIFYFTFLWLITWPILFFMTKWWTVYTVRWSWSRMEQDDEQQRAWKVFASISEQEWAEKHANLIKSLVLEKFQGDATGFPADVPDERVERSMRGSMPNTGNANMDAAVNFVQGGVGLWNAVQGRGSGDPRAWGADS